MSISIKINSGEDQPFAVELEHLPTTIEVDRPEANLAIVPFGLFALVAVFFVLNEFSLALALSVTGALGAILAYLFFTVMARRGRKNIMAFEKKRVVVTEAGLLRDKHWQADYSEFKGVYMRRRVARSGRSKSTYVPSNSIYQIIELQHSDREKTLPLFVDLTNKAPTKRWTSYAELFNIPSVREGY